MLLHTDGIGKWLILPLNLAVSDDLTLTLSRTLHQWWRVTHKIRSTAVISIEHRDTFIITVRVLGALHTFAPIVSLSLLPVIW